MKNQALHDRPRTKMAPGTCHIACRAIRQPKVMNMALKIEVPSSKMAPGVAQVDLKVTQVASLVAFLAANRYCWGGSHAFLWIDRIADIRIYVVVSWANPSRVSEFIFSFCSDAQLRPGILPYNVTGPITLQDPSLQDPPLWDP